MTQTGTSSGIGAHCPEAIGGYCRAFLLRVVVRRGGKLSYRSQFFSPPMKTVFAELRGDGLRQAHRPTQGSIIGKSLRFFSTLRVGPLDERKARRLRGPGFAQNRKRLFPNFVGEGLIREGESFGAWIESQQSMPTSLIT